MPASRIASSSSRVFAAVPEPSSTSSAAPVSATISLGARLEDRALGARRVVLGQLADPVEQLGAAGVVEVLGRQLLERPGEPVEHVVGERALVAGAEVESIGSSIVGSGDRRAAISVVSGEPHAGEDLPALGQVPVAERRGGDARVRGPRAAAQHAVALAEEHLGVLAVRVRDEAGIAGELDAVHSQTEPDARRRPAGPRSPPSPTRPRWGGAPRARGRRRRPRTRRRGTTGASGCAAVHGRAVVGDVVLLLPRPSPRRTTTRGARSRRPRRSAARCALVTGVRAIANAGDVDARGAGARCRRRSRVGRAQLERAAGDLDEPRVGVAGGAPARLAGRRAARRAPSPGASSRCAGARGGGPARAARRAGAPSAERARRAPLMYAQRARRGRAARVAAHRARRLERVVDRGQLLAQQRRAAEAVHEPQVLVGGDVRRGPRPAGS